MSPRFAVAAVLVVGCTSPAGPKVASSPVAAADMAHSSAVPAVPPHLPERAEVEISGTVVVPKGARGEPRIFVTDGPCFDPGVHSFTETPPAVGSTTFFVEIFVPQRTNLWVCAALIPRQGAIVYTASLERNPLNAVGSGEVAFPGITLTLRKGAPTHRPPPPIAHPAR